MPPKSVMAKPTAAQTTKRKATEVADDQPSNNLKRRKQNGALPTKKSIDSDEDDAGFAFTRPVKAVKKAAAAPTRTSPRNHGVSKQIYTSATPKATKPPAETNFSGLSNASDSFVALPVSDTPIIRKNQQLRQGGPDGRRRSSLSKRGKRASSIGNGFQSLPHPDIPPTEFYKHISGDLPDPVRMKQLLAWCARRVLDETKSRPITDKPETDEQLQAANIAKTIEEEVLKDLIENRITTSWYHHEDQEVDTTEKRPHPQNVANAQKLQEMEARLQKLQAEEQTWNELRTKHLSTKSASPTTASGERFAKKTEQSIDLDLLSAQEAEFVHSITSRPLGHVSQASSDEWLKEAESNLEFQVDSLLHALHKQQQYLKEADEMGLKLLEKAAQGMATFESAGSETSKSRGIGTIDILRHLSHAQKD